MQLLVFNIAIIWVLSIKGYAEKVLEEKYTPKTTKRGISAKHEQAKSLVKLKLNTALFVFHIEKADVGAKRFCVV